MVSKKAKKQIVDGAAELFVKLLSEPAIQQRLINAPKDVMDWATERRSNRLPSTSQASPEPKGHFGQRGMERRVAAMRNAVELALPAHDVVGRQQLIALIDEVDRSVQMAGGLPFVKRKRAHSRIDKKLDAMELALVDAMLPKH